MNNKLNFTLKSENLAIELLNTAEHYYEQGKYALATGYYTQVIELELTKAKLTYALYMRGMTLYKSGKQAEAIADWRRVQALGFQHSSGIDLMDLLPVKTLD